jgi:hypothetical protein
LSPWQWCCSANAKIVAKVVASMQLQSLCSQMSLSLFLGATFLSSRSSTALAEFCAETTTRKRKDQEGDESSVSGNGILSMQAMQGSSRHCPLVDALS